MKTPFRTSALLATAVMFVLAGCGGEPQQDEGQATAEGTPPSEIVTTAAKPKTPDTGTMTAEELHTAYFTAADAWKGQTVTLTGYPSAFSDKVTIGGKVSLLDAEGSKKVVVECNLAEKSTDVLLKAETVTVSGEIDRVFGQGTDRQAIVLKNGQVVATGQPIAADKTPSPGQAGTAFGAKAFYDKYFEWEGKEVTVTGYYHSHTTSTNKFGKSYRVDLTAGPGGSKLIGCEMPAEPPAEIAQQRNGVVVKGKVDGVFFKQVKLVDCEVLSLGQ